MRILFSRLLLLQLDSLEYVEISQIVKESFYISLKVLQQKQLGVRSSFDVLLSQICGHEKMLNALLINHWRYTLYYVLLLCKIGNQKGNFYL